MPLIDEYYGFCHATGVQAPAPEAARFRFCNQGNAKGCCESFPAEESRSSLRYEIVMSDSSKLSLLCIEEQNYAPLRWYAVEYRCCDEQLEPDLQDLCVRSQVLAFCRSYRARFAVTAPLPA